MAGWSKLEGVGRGTQSDPAPPGFRTPWLVLAPMGPDVQQLGQVVPTSHFSGAEHHSSQPLAVDITAPCNTAILALSAATGMEGEMEFGARASPVDLDQASPKKQTRKKKSRMVRGCEGAAAMGVAPPHTLRPVGGPPCSGRPQFLALQGRLPSEITREELAQWCVA